MALAPGQVVGQRYRVVNEIATGGMGAVHRVARIDDGVELALKVIRRDLVGGETAMARFRREAQLLAALEHPGVVKFFDAGLTEDGSMFLVMELLEGETLLRCFMREAPLAAPRVAALVRGMATALDAVHSVGVVHRDLKPGNVFLTPTGVKLVDFGIAKAADVTRLTMTGQVVGTVRYMAPEQLLGNATDGRADVYAVGVMAWAALAGGPPFVGAGMDAVQEVLAGVPRLERSAPEIGPAICDVIHRATARDPNARFATAGDFAAALEAAAGTAPTRVTRPSTGFAPIATDVTAHAARPEATAPTVASPAPPATTSPVSAKAKGRGPLIAGAAVLALSGLAVVGALALSHAASEADPAPMGDAPTSAPVEPAPSEEAVEPRVETEEAPAPERTLKIHSDPPNAEVEVDGALVGNTPVEVPMPVDAPYEVTVSQRGYQSQSRTIGTDWATDEVHFTLDEVEEGPAHGTMRGSMRESEVFDPWAQ